MSDLDINHWTLYTSDEWVLDTVHGYKIEFSCVPFQNNIPSELKFPDDQALLVTQEVSKLLEKGAI